MTVLADPFAVPQEDLEDVQVPVTTPVLAISTPTGSTPAPAASLAAQPMPAVPRFEGIQVAQAVTKIQGTYVLPADQIVLSMDDRVRVIGEYRVVKVGFEADKNGDTIRVHYLKPIEAERCPYDPSDPKDDGVWRQHVTP
jgi:hypothetical protein